MTDEEKKARRREYYQKNKERIKEYAKNRYANMSDVKKEARKEYMRKYQQRRHKDDKKDSTKTRGEAAIKNYKGITIISTFGIVENLNYDTDKLLNATKRKIEKLLNDVERQDRIVITDKYGTDICVEVYEKKNNEDYIKLIINKLDDFLENNLKIFAEDFVF